MMMRLLLMPILFLAMAAGAFAQGHAPAEPAISGAEHAPVASVPSEHTTRAAEPAAHGGAEAPPTVFAGTMLQSVAAIVVFLLLLALLYKYAWGPILSGLQERENKIKRDLEEAEASARQAAETLRQHEQKLAAAQAEAQELIERGRADATKLSAQLRADTQAEIDQIRKRAEADIRSAKQQAINELYAEAANLSTQIAEKILKRQMNPEDHRALIQQSLAELSQKPQS
jgi:F-type H+-transporting ATPase subunit b